MHKYLEEFYAKSGQRKPEVFVEDIESITHLQWLQARQSGIGGSDAGAVYLGKGKFKTAFEVAISKSVPITEEENNTPEDEFRFGYGHCIEEVLLKYYSMKFNAETFVERGMYRNPEYPAMLADCDGFAKLEDGTVIGIECKSTSPHNKSLWASGVYGEDGDIGVLDYYYQVQHYMAVFGLYRFDIICDFKQANPYDITVVTVYRDEEIIESLCKKEQYFFTHLDEVELELPNSCNKKQAEAIRKHLVNIGAEFEEEDLVSNCEKIVRLNGRKKELSMQLNAIEEQIEANKIPLVSAMGDNEVVTCGDYKISNKKSIVARYNTKALKELHELDCYKTFSEQTRFSIKYNEKKEA